MVAVVGSLALQHRAFDHFKLLYWSIVLEKVS